TYLPSADAPDVADPPVVASGTITFGSVNNFSKVTPQVLQTWARILARVNGSRLIILADPIPELLTRVREAFATDGVSADRCEVRARLLRLQYLGLINGLDIALDPFPFNGHTTTCDCLWQGVPVVSLAGRTYVSRFGSSALNTLGLSELIATSVEEYI